MTLPKESTHSNICDSKFQLQYKVYESGSISVGMVLKIWLKWWCWRWTLQLLINYMSVVA